MGFGLVDQQTPRSLRVVPAGAVIFTTASTTVLDEIDTLRVSTTAEARRYCTPCIAGINTACAYVDVASKAKKPNMLSATNLFIRMNFPFLRNSLNKVTDIVSI
ncbi:hypothetical protein DDR33_02560 [Pararcticibacter amylolyticus]|uniref:Uncharacterized protein n=1 Tax=Pararcticibacter amylolyticus TaxID=2173175 RepID=A0A2U2PKK2_9SPHI|nr:hypothetical protein DDR33_02560 [Pararcticibacter amylolyticus]